MSAAGRMQMREGMRDQAYGQNYSPTFVDRFGVWLSARQIRRYHGFPGRQTARRFWMRLPCLLCSKRVAGTRGGRTRGFRTRSDLKSRPDSEQLREFFPQFWSRCRLLVWISSSVSLCWRPLRIPVQRWKHAFASFGPVASACSMSLPGEGSGFLNSPLFAWV
jgi:hypothetical protein